MSDVLPDLGLSERESAVYLWLLRAEERAEERGDAACFTRGLIALGLRMPRANVGMALSSLMNRGLVTAAACNDAYGPRCTTVLP